jgi:hypothetical protein
MERPKDVGAMSGSRVPRPTQPRPWNIPWNISIDDYHIKQCVKSNKSLISEPKRTQQAQKRVRKGTCSPWSTFGVRSSP